MTEPVRRASQELVEAADALRAALGRHKALTTDVAARVHPDIRVVDVLTEAHVPTIRQEITEAIGRFQSARHRFRLAVLALGIEQGATIAEVGRALGVSRQFASRLAAELNDA